MRAGWLVVLAVVGCDDGDGDGDGVVGAVSFPSSGEVALVDGRAFDDGALRVVLTSFPVDCAAVEDGLGWSTPAGGAWVGFYPDEGGEAELFEGDGEMTQLTDLRAFTADVTDSGAAATGALTISDGSGEADFTVEHCGAMDPFGS